MLKHVNRGCDYLIVLVACVRYINFSGVISNNSYVFYIVTFNPSHVFYTVTIFQGNMQQDGFKKGMRQTKQRKQANSNTSASPGMFSSYR